MKSFLIVILFYSTAAFGAPNSPDAKSDSSELSQAYQREVLFLSTYKQELQEKKENLQKGLGKKVRAAKRELAQLESRWIRLQTDNELLIDKLTALERDQEFKTENSQSLQGVIDQAKASFDINLSEKTSMEASLVAVFTEAESRLEESRQILKKEGTFYDTDGREIRGEILSLGSVAQYGIADKEMGPLYPSGGGAMKIWDWFSKPVQSWALESLPSTLPIFIYENANKEYVLKSEKSWLQTIQSGGFIGWVIVFLGALALVLSLLRFFLLRKAKLTDVKNMEAILGHVKQGDVKTARQICGMNSNAVTRVVSKTLASLSLKNAEVDDVIIEGILTESKTIDRFGVFILVIASVAPLLGLLGTVTGMISTFDVITQFGTGNPKLLSGGISEALITTMLGLMVAIPALLVGQYLSSFNEGIKADMEKWALAARTAFLERTV